MFLAKPAYAGEEMGAPQILAGNDQWFISSDMVTMWVIMVLLALVCIIGTRHMRKHPSGLQNFFGDRRGIIARHGGRYYGRETGKTLWAFSHDVFPDDFML